MTLDNTRNNSGDPQEWYIGTAVIVSRPDAVMNQACVTGSEQ